MSVSDKVWELRPRNSNPNYKDPKESDIYVLGASTTTKSRVKPRKEPLYVIEVIEEDSTRCKVHYIGYDSSFDEWKSKDDIVELGDDELDRPIERFSLYNELSIRIKTTLNSNRKESPIVRINMPFDKVEFDGSLKLCGKPKCKIHGVQHYSIMQYQDLNPYLGADWHFRGINQNGDFCFVILNTVDFYLYRRRPIKEYKPGSPLNVVHLNAGFMLVFLFVKGNGTPNQFGTDTDIFVN